MGAQCRLFQEVWREGVPVVVRGVRKGYQWNPITMCRATTENNSRFDGEQEIEVRHLAWPNLVPILCFCRSSALLGSWSFRGV